MIAHSVSVLHGKDQPALKIESRDTKESAIASCICTQCSAASGIFITNQKRLVIGSHLPESLLAAMALALEKVHWYQSPDLEEPQSRELTVSCE